MASVINSVIGTEEEKRKRYFQFAWMSVLVELLKKHIQDEVLRSELLAQLFKAVEKVGSSNDGSSLYNEQLKRILANTLPDDKKKEIIAHIAAISQQWATTQASINTTIANAANIAAILNAPSGPLAAAQSSLNALAAQFPSVASASTPSATPAVPGLVLNPPVAGAPSPIPSPAQVDELNGLRVIFVDAGKKLEHARGSLESAEAELNSFEQLFHSMGIELSAVSKKYSNFDLSAIDAERRAQQDEIAAQRRELATTKAQISASLASCVQSRQLVDSILQLAAQDQFIKRRDDHFMSQQETNPSFPVSLRPAAGGRRPEEDGFRFNR